MTVEDRLQKIVEGPVYLLEGNDGMVYGNSQFLALEVRRLRKTLREIQSEVGSSTRAWLIAKKALDED